MKGLKKGFTLIELLVVVLIIGILAAVALPQYQKAVTKTRMTNVMAALNALKKNTEIYHLENGQGSSINNLDYVNNNPIKVPTGKIGGGYFLYAFSYASSSETSQVIAYVTKTSGSNGPIADCRYYEAQISQEYQNGKWGDLRCSAGCVMNASGGASTNTSGTSICQALAALN